MKVHVHPSLNTLGVELQLRLSPVSFPLSVSLSLFPRQRLVQHLVVSAHSLPVIHMPVMAVLQGHAYHPYTYQLCLRPNPKWVWLKC